MNILLIGNGFDLAHGLPTKYTDFLVFCKMVLEFIELNKIDKILLEKYNKFAAKDEKTGKFYVEITFKDI